MNSPTPTAPATPALNKEQIYDAEIFPLMAQIVEIAKTHGIAMIASFAIPTPEDDGLACSTLLPDGEGENPPSHLKAMRILREPAQFFAMTIVGGAKS